MRNFWTTKEEQYLIKHYPDMRSEDIAIYTGKSLKSVYYKAHKLGLYKSEEFKRSEASGRANVQSEASIACRFIKGHVPANKGKKMSDELRTKVSRTWFKKGNKPHNTKQDGYIHKRSDNYYWIRIAEGKWKELHRHIWEQINGPIPQGYNVIFIDGNTCNCVIENLKLVSNAELLDINYHSRYPLELKQLVQLKGVLQREINKQLKNK